MNSRPLMSSLAVAAVIGAGISAAVAPASASPADASCASGYCVWSGANYTGTKVVLDIQGVNSCITPSAPGYDAARSAASTGDVYFWSSSPRRTAPVPDRRPCIKPCRRSTRRCGVSRHLSSVFDGVGQVSASYRAVRTT